MSRSKTKKEERQPNNLFRFSLLDFTRLKENKKRRGKIKKIKREERNKDRMRQEIQYKDEYKKEKEEGKPKEETKIK